ncbi:lactoylglutathione lyase [Pelolinea submarina]|nr:lactoylglutathione lyase [Pelolinea submarina]
MVLEVDDVAAMYEHVLSENWPLAAELQQRPWGLTDFRVVDPSGYYLRITSRV